VLPPSSGQKLAITTENHELD